MCEYVYYFTRTYAAHAHFAALAPILSILISFPRVETQSHSDGGCDVGSACTMRSILLPDARGFHLFISFNSSQSPDKGIMCNAKFGRPINQSCKPKNEQKKTDEKRPRKQNKTGGYLPACIGHMSMYE